MTGRSPQLGPMAIHTRIDAASEVIYARSPHALPEYPPRLTDRLVYWAEHAPQRPFIGEPAGEGRWRCVSYANALSRVRALAQAMLERNLSPQRPLMVLSGNDIEHALLGLAAQYVGVPYVPVSPSYSLASNDFARLRHIVAATRPGMVYAADGGSFAAAVAAAVPRTTEVAVKQGRLDERRASTVERLESTTATEAVDAAHGAVGPDTIAKVLYTSGSTGMPKGVINTQRMLCSNQAMLRSYFAFVAEEPPTLLDWLPWHHTFGGNHNLGLVLYNGGTLYIDDGRPTPEAVGRTLENLKSVSPTIYFNVPKGYEALLPHLRADAELARRLFARLRVLFCAAAALPEHTWRVLEALGRSVTGEPIPVLAGYGATETAPSVLFTTPEIARPGAVGLPVPGVELKLVPFEGRYEIRARGPNVTPGYWQQPEKSREVFDDEGYYRLGDALRFVDSDDPGQGMCFDGRLAENFKLATGTWVNVGELRGRLIESLAPLVKDVIVVGENRDYLAGIVIPAASAQEEAAQQAVGASTTPVSDPAQQLRQRLSESLNAHIAGSSGSSTCVRRLIVLDEPLSLDAGELTDKGTINQRAVRSRRRALVDKLYADPPSAEVVTADGA